MIVNTFWKMFVHKVLLNRVGDWFLGQLFTLAFTAFIKDILLKRREKPFFHFYL